MPRARRVQFMLAAIAAVIVLSGASASAQSNPYRWDESWRVELPPGRKLGGVIGVDFDRAGHIWIFERCDGEPCADSKLSPIFEFEPSGKLMKNFGAGLVVAPHGFTVDKDDNVWVTDNGVKDGKGQQVIKFSPDGRVLMRLGTAGAAGNDQTHFNRPTDVLVAPNGDIFVTDGHGGDSNARVVKFSKDGKFIKAWGTKGSGPGQFDTMHALAMDSKGRLYVGDRGNSRIQVFDQDGKFLEEIKQFGRPSGIFIDKNDTMYVTDDESDAKTNPGMKKGIRIGSLKDGKVKFLIPPMGPEDNPTTKAEGVTADPSGNIFAAETDSKYVRKYVRK